MVVLLFLSGIEGLFFGVMVYGLLEILSWVFIGIDFVKIWKSFFWLRER